MTLSPGSTAVWGILVSGLERTPAGKAEVRDTAGNVVTPVVDIDEDKLQ